MVASGKGGPSTRRARRLGISGLVVVGLLLFGVAPVVGDGLNSRPSPAPQIISATHQATSAQSASAGGVAGISTTKHKAKRNRSKAKPRLRRVTLSSRITDHEILTEEGKGTFVGIKCPTGSRAISGGVLSRYINLVVSSSSPNHPLTRKYTPGIWWLTVTNVNVDGNGGTLPWQGVVNCLSPARISKG